ncbi:MAG: FHA domain-containing protein [Chloroflexota bacterium]
MIKTDSLTDNKIPKNIFLVVNHQLFTLYKTSTNIGRNPENDLIINEPGISRTHAEVQFEEGKFVVMDMGSTNGTKVNGKDISRHELSSGDTITLANAPILFIDRSEKMLRQALDTTTNLAKEIN